MVLIPCKNCCELFEPRTPSNKYCSYKCKQEFNKNNLPKKSSFICRRCGGLKKYKQLYYCEYCAKERLVEMKELDRKLSRKYGKKRYHRLKDDPNFRASRKRYMRESLRKRYQTDKEYATSSILSTLLHQNFLVYYKTGKVGLSHKYKIDYKAIFEHLKPFPKDIKKYQIDHIIPRCSFKLTNEDGSPNLKEISKAFAPENHQWLTTAQNIDKIKKDRLLSIR